MKIFFKQFIIYEDNILTNTPTNIVIIIDINNERNL